MAGLERESVIGASVRVSELCEHCVMTALPHQGLAEDANILKTIIAENPSLFGVRAEIVEPGAIRRGDRVRLV